MALAVSIPLVFGYAESQRALSQNESGRLASYVKKDASGARHWYIDAISSGPMLDAHGEQMSRECLEDFQRQTVEKTLLFIHPHTDDLLTNHIGKLDSSWITKNGEWGTSIRLWDESDEVPAANMAKAKDFLNMVRGEGPYAGRPTAIRQVSVQGLLEKTNVQNNPDGTRMINKIDLSAIAAVERGAYPQQNFSSVQKVFKQYDNGGIIDDQTAVEEDPAIMRQFYDHEYRMTNALREVLTSNDEPAIKKARIATILLEFNNGMMECLEANNFQIKQEGGNMPTPEETEKAKKAEEAAVEEEKKRKAAEEEEQKKKAAVAKMADKGSIVAALKILEEALLGNEIANAPVVDMTGEGKTVEGNAVSDKDPYEGMAKDGPPPSAGTIRAGKDAPPKIVPAANMPEGSELTETSQVQKAIQAMQALGLSDAQIKENVENIRKQANPMRVTHMAIEEVKKENEKLRKDFQAVSKSLEDFMTQMAGLKVGDSAPVTVANGLQTGPVGNAAHTAALYAQLPEDVRKSLEGMPEGARKSVEGILFQQAGLNTDSGPVALPSNVSDISKALQEGYGKRRAR